MSDAVPHRGSRGLVEAVRPGSLAEELGIAPGELVLEAAGRPVRDVVDYQFLLADEVVPLTLDGPAGPRTIVVKKHPDEDLGLEFADAAWDDTRLCNNKCPFCFLKGLPRGMRRTLYVKDDDYRLSFLHGNFVTLTNLSDDDWARLEEQRLGPLNVSVHATEPALRRRILGNPSAPEIVPQLRRLGDLGIYTNTQLVISPGINDGAHLDRSIEDLAALYPYVQSISVVPVGASERLEGMPSGEGFLIECEPEYAREIIRQVRPYQRRFRRDHGRTLLYLADEYYLAAGAGVPAAGHYDGFAQYENGIGMTRKLLLDWQAAKRRLARRPLVASGRHVTLACGTLADPALKRLAAEASVLTGARIDVHAVPNYFFGERINVSGLLPGQEFQRELAGRELGEFLVLPRSSLDYFGRHFLDDMRPVELEQALGRPIGFAYMMSEVLDFIAEEPAPPAENTATNGRAWSA
jgi:putative radical SAM enzyme (TIGR03279 family)